MSTYVSAFCLLLLSAQQSKPNTPSRMRMRIAPFAIRQSTTSRRFALGESSLLLGRCTPHRKALLGCKVYGHKNYHILHDRRVDPPFTNGDTRRGEQKITCVTLHGKQESEKAHFNPVGLVRSLRDWEGQPLDVMVQQDASEFITQFFQQVR